ncbi:MAG TPA: alpha/beta hydrolase [Jatrophihabitantaceae bacterium]
MGYFDIPVQTDLSLADAGTQDETTSRIDPVARIAGWVVARTTLTRPEVMGARRRRLSRRLPTPHNRLTQGLLGAAAEQVTAEDRWVAVDGGSITVRVYRPGTAGRTESLPLVVYFHGGGWVIGSIGMADGLCSRIARALPAVVVSVDYRLSPEFPFPVPLDDSLAATEWTVRHADEFGADSDRLGVAGDSAGGTLATEVAATRRSESSGRVIHQSLIYPVTDLTLSSDSMTRFGSAPFLTASDMRGYRRLYLAGQDPRNPRVSPLFIDDLAGMPPTVIHTAAADPLRDDGERYARRLADAGVAVAYDCVPGTAHGFSTFPGLYREAARAEKKLLLHMSAHLCVTRDRTARIPPAHPSSADRGQQP